MLQKVKVTLWSPLKMESSLKKLHPARFEVASRKAHGKIHAGPVIHYDSLAQLILHLSALKCGQPLQ